MSTDIAALVSDNLDLWAGAIDQKSGAGRGGGRRVGYYGIERLRALILDLAVRGKLVSQDARDEPAASLLTRIDKGRSKLIDDGFIRGSKPAVDQANTTEPFPIPRSWVWVRLDRLGAIVGGGTPSATDPSNFTEPGQGIAWLTPADLSGFKEKFIGRGQRDLTVTGIKASSAKVMPAGTVLFTSRAPIGYVAIAANDVATNQGFKSIVPSIGGLSEFIALSLKAFAEEIDANAPGTTFKEVSGKIVGAIPFPLPPLAEQQRIVAKVDELMALCDALEAQTASALEAHQTLVETLLANLVNAADSSDLAREWERLKSHFDTLFTTHASIDALRQAILDLGIRGKFSNVQRWPKAPVRLGTVARLQNGYAFKSEWFENSGVRLLRNLNVSHGRADWDEAVYLSESMAADYDRFQLRDGDVVLALDRPFISTGTKVAKINKGDLPALLLQRVGRFQASSAIWPEFIYLWVCSPLFSGQIDPGRSNGVPHISSKQVEAANIFVPSLAEQERIIHKVDELLAICDDLASRLKEAAQSRKDFADAIVDRAAA